MNELQRPASAEADGLWRRLTRPQQGLMHALDALGDAAALVDHHAREVLHVCNACGSRELVRLARHFRAATEQELRAEREEAALQAAWARSNSAFRTTMPPFSPPKKRDQTLRSTMPAPLAAAKVTGSAGDGAAANTATLSLRPRPWLQWLGLGTH